LPARILIVDDNPLVRNTVRAFLNYHSLRVCGEAGDGKEAVEKARLLKPDIVLMDVNMPGMNGIQTAAEILNALRNTKIVFLTVHNNPGTVNATRMWSHGFVPKSAIGTALIPTLDRVAASSEAQRSRGRRPAQGAT